MICFSMYRPRSYHNTWGRQNLEVTQGWMNVCEALVKISDNTCYVLRTNSIRYIKIIITNSFIKQCDAESEAEVYTEVQVTCTLWRNIQIIYLPQVNFSWSTLVTG